MPKELRSDRRDDIFKEYVIARIEKAGEKFEVLVKPDAVQRIRDGKEVDLLRELAIDEIFKDAHKGSKASEEKMMEFFGTTEPLAVAKQIVQRGEIQLTTEQRRQMLEAKRKQIVQYIAANAINPQTGAPHPPQRIENAMEEAKVHVDPFKSIEEQVKEVLDALRPLIPIRFEKVRIAVKLSAEDSAKAYGDLKSFGTILKEEWSPTGAWLGVVEMPAGLQTEFLERLVSVIPLNGRYIPQRGDAVIGEVVDQGPSHWLVDIHSPYPAPLHATESPWRVEFGDTARYLKVGDVIMCHVLSVDEIKRVQLTMQEREARRLTGGMVIEISPTKVPRVIGKQGSMVSLIMDLTGCRIYVGQNGRIWLDGDDRSAAIATMAIRLIEERAQAVGLTEAVRELIEREKGRGRGPRPS